jgi:glycosyltransferase involved in cell wall biosynthesis
MPHNVLYLHHVAQMSGAEQSLRLLMRSVDRARVRPLFAGPSTGPFPEALAAEDIPTFPVTFGSLKRLPGLARAVWRLRQLIREQRVTVLHANGPQTNLCAAVAGRLAGIPVVWHERNLLYGDMMDVDRLLSGWASAIICNADAIRERFRGSAGWDRAVTIHNAVDTTQFNPGVAREPFRRDCGAREDETLVGIVGRIGLGKGHECFVEAAIRALQSGLSVRFVIVGDPLFEEDRWRAQSLRAQIARAGLEDRIRLAGFRSDVPSVMRGLDVLVLASDAEPCGRVLLEAMASGTAIVATNTGGTPELVRHEREGLLVPPRDSSALSEAIGRLVRTPDLRAALGRAGVMRANESFTRALHVERTLQVYDKVAGHGAR